MRAVEYKSFERLNFLLRNTWKNYLGGSGNDLEFGKLKSLDTRFTGFLFLKL